MGASTSLTALARLDSPETRCPDRLLDGHRETQDPGLRALLDGDFDELRTRFRMTDMALAPDWSVNLVPRSARLKKFAPRLIVDGS